VSWREPLTALGRRKGPGVTVQSIPEATTKGDSTSMVVKKSIREDTAKVPATSVTQHFVK
jgi:hypothetical protein